MGWFSDNVALAWLGLAIFLGVIELITLESTFMMLAAGALVAMFATLFGASFVMAVLLALAVSVSLLAFLRPRIIDRLHGGPDLKIGPEALIGATALVLEPVRPHVVGRVKIGGDEWSALPLDAASAFEEGVTARVGDIKGATAYLVVTTDDEDPPPVDPVA